jgi:hypothetical protein
VPLNSVQLYVQSLLDNLPIPGMTVPLQAYITPPTIDDLDSPKAYVWGTRLRINRQTMPRGAGFKHLAWLIDIYLVYETNPDSPTLDQEFPLIVDAVMNKLWTTTTPLFITDPVTGIQSQLLNVGENMEFEYPPERTPATLRMLYYTARIGMELYEAVQA